MVRGKAFEFTVLLALEAILPEDEFLVSKAPMNAQSGAHDIDVAVLHKPTNVEFSIECKLADKASYRLRKTTKHSLLRVKCMRSRTLGEAKVEKFAPIMGVSEATLKIHNDQYRPGDFDFLVTSIGNAFYSTDEQGLFVFSPTPEGKQFLIHLSQNDSEENLKDFAFDKLYIASANSLAITDENPVTCTRRKCTTPHNCGFIPNYPVIEFRTDALIPEPPWYEIESSATLFRIIAQNQINS